MKLPRFSLRTLFVVLTLIGVALGWVGYQLNWIRQRHIYINRGDVRSAFPYPGSMTGLKITAPWSLRLFGEYAADVVDASESEADQVRRLFPEARIRIKSPH